MREGRRICSVEREGTKIAIRFHPETPIDPAALVSVVRSRKGIKLDPSGVLWMEVTRGEQVSAAVRNVLLSLRGQGYTCVMMKVMRNVILLASFCAPWPLMA